MDDRRHRVSGGTGPGLQADSLVPRRSLPDVGGIGHAGMRETRRQPAGRNHRASCVAPGRASPAGPRAISPRRRARARCGCRPRRRVGPRRGRPMGRLARRPRTGILPHSVPPSRDPRSATACGTRSVGWEPVARSPRRWGASDGWHLSRVPRAAPVRRSTRGRGRSICPWRGPLITPKHARTTQTGTECRRRMATGSMRLRYQGDASVTPSCAVREAGSDVAFALVVALPCRCRQRCRPV